MRYALFAVAVLLAGCGSSSPTAPTTPSQPAPPAATPQPAPLEPTQVIQTGGFEFFNCGATTCDGRAVVRNVGPGCAQRVSGSTEFYEEGARIGPSYTWQGPDTMRPATEYQYVIPQLDARVSREADTYRTTPQWITVRCE